MAICRAELYSARTDITPFATRPRAVEALSGRVRTRAGSGSTAFPPPSSPDKSDAGLRLRISFLFWLTIAQDDGNPPPFECLGGSSRPVVAVSYPRAQISIK